MIELPEAIVAVIMRDEQTLVILRSGDVSAPGVWAPLSGKVEPDEDQASAVAREIMEEVGLEVRPIRKVWECVSDDRSCLLHWWLADYVAGAVVLDEREVSDAKWLRPATFAALDNTFAGDRCFFAEVFPRLAEPEERPPRG